MRKLDEKEAREILGTTIEMLEAAGFAQVFISCALPDKRVATRASCCNTFLAAVVESAFGSIDDIDLKKRVAARAVENIIPNGEGE